MQSRLDAQPAAPAAYRALFALAAYVHNSSRLEHSLLNLVFLRASQINGCAQCIDMHSKEARPPARASSASMNSTPGGKYLFTASGNGCSGLD